MSDENEPEEQYELVLPFLCCSDNGGTYDPNAFTAGFSVGQIYQSLANGQSFSGWIPQDTRETVDLIAMRYGFKPVFRDGDSGLTFCEVLAV